MSAPVDIISKIRSCTNETYKKMLYNILVDENSPWKIILAKLLHCDVYYNRKPKKPNDVDMIGADGKIIEQTVMVISGYGKIFEKNDLVLLGLEYRDVVLENILIEKINYDNSIKEVKEVDKKVQEEQDEKTRMFNIMNQYITTLQKIKYWTYRREETHALSVKFAEEGNMIKSRLHAPCNFPINENDIRVWYEECCQLHKTLTLLIHNRDKPKKEIISE